MLKLCVVELDITQLVLYNLVKNKHIKKRPSEEKIKIKSCSNPQNLIPKTKEQPIKLVQIVVSHDTSLTHKIVSKSIHEAVNEKPSNWMGLANVRSFRKRMQRKCNKKHQWIFPASKLTVNKTTIEVFPIKTNKVLFAPN